MNQMDLKIESFGKNSLAIRDHIWDHMEVVLNADKTAIEEVKLGQVRGEKVSKNVPVVPKNTVKIKSKVEVIKQV